ncbi:MAG: hypothetical protein IJV71_07315 [Lachnospiraceae bacterium]|nr:hypothetical protein [Lachnospiraceae bacterium]
MLVLEALERIDYKYLHDLLSLTARLIEVVAKDSVNIKREVVLMGGGKVLEMESEKIYSDGISQGMAGSIIKFLERVGSLPDTLYNRISKETDVAVLDRWLMMAPYVSSIEEFESKM